MAADVHYRWACAQRVGIHNILQPRDITADTAPSAILGRLGRVTHRRPDVAQMQHLLAPHDDVATSGVRLLHVLQLLESYQCSWGLINAFGVWQSYYSSTLIPDQSSSNISWIGSIQAFLLCCCTIFAGPMYDRGHARVMVWIGSFMVVFGLMMVSRCDNYWQLMLAQGICMGIGSGGLFITSVAIIPSYFTTKRAFAMGITASGSSIGGVIYPTVFQSIQPRVGFGWATRIIGFIALATLILPCACIRMRSRPLPRKKIIDFSGFREMPFCLFSAAAFIGFIGLYIPFFYISEFGLEQDGLGQTLVGPINVLAVCTMIAGMLGFVWNAVDNLGGIVVWALLYGAFSGAFVSLQPSTVVSITDDMGVVGGRLGMNTFCAALGILIGNPIAGVIVGHGSWIGLQCFCGGTLLLGAVLIIATRWSRVGLHLKRKA
ncbi:MFS general substrate transporter [Teratosphaeria nubilosa]|uniref:MFS general substrate transporter n=1 Tax=Teratosphaeria nubilosa TaxID=161662 RepID=A0A6G1LNU3_9PEZI|nr:MFS general substrate transporter [Teratosphaeria nubilosa]